MLKLLSVLIPFALTSASAADIFKRYIIADTHERSFLEESWEIYLTDKCEVAYLDWEKEIDLRENGLRRCKDNSVSFVQPKARGIGGWEGKCGQTFGANSLFSLCKESVDPASYFTKYLRDITPGVRPKTLERGMQSVFSRLEDSCPKALGIWSYSAQKNHKSYVDDIKERLVPKFSHPNLLEINRFSKNYFRIPVGVLVQNPGGKYLHWVTVVDVLEDNSRCEFVINHWDNQYQLPCDKLAAWAYDVGVSYPIILKSYSIVSFI